MTAVRATDSRDVRATIALAPGAAYFLHVEFGAATQSFDREAAAALLKALRVLDGAGLADAEALALTLIRAFRPDFLPQDLPVLRGWLAQFEDELAAEDKRENPRFWTNKKRLAA